jgi:hypothetical protein
MRILFALLFAGIATSAFAQVAMHCCLQPPLTAADVAQRRAFELAQSESIECKRMHVGCPEGTFTQSVPEGGYSAADNVFRVLMQKSHTR